MENFLIVISQLGDFDSVLDTATQPLYSFLEVLIPALFGIFLTLGIIFGIFAGFKMVKAKDTAQASEAKEHFQHIIIGFGIAIVLTAILFACREPLLDLIKSNADYSTQLVGRIL